MTDKYIKDAIEHYHEWKADTEREREAREYKWTLEETESIRASNPQRAAVLSQTLWKESHDRGDYKLPHEMTRSAAQRYLSERGIGGEVWNSAELRRVIRENPGTEQAREGAGNIPAVHRAEQDGGRRDGQQVGRAVRRLLESPSRQSPHEIAAERQFLSQRDGDHRPGDAGDQPGNGQTGGHRGKVLGDRRVGSG